MFKKKIENDTVDATLTELVDRYINDYFISVDYENNGMAHVWIGTRRDKFAGNETSEPSDE